MEKTLQERLADWKFMKSTPEKIGNTYEVEYGPDKKLSTYFKSFKGHLIVERTVRLASTGEEMEYSLLDVLHAGEEGYILIGENLIKKYSAYSDINFPGFYFLENVDVGSRVRMTLSSKSGDVIRKDFIIKGILKSKIDEISIRMFVLDKELKRILPTNKEQFQEIAVRTDYEYAPILVAQVKQFMGSNVARIQTSDEAIPSFLHDLAETMSVLGNALSSIALIVATITIFIVVYINAITKRKFIGIMKGIGVSPAAIQLSYVLQAFFYGILGSMIGIVITFGFLQPYLAAHPIDFPFSDGILEATPMGTLLRFLILIVVTIIAGYVPAKMIVRRNTLDAILGR